MQNDHCSLSDRDIHFELLRRRKKSETHKLYGTNIVIPASISSGPINVDKNETKISYDVTIMETWHNYKGHGAHGVVKAKINSSNYKICVKVVTDEIEFSTWLQTN